LSPFCPLLNTPRLSCLVCTRPPLPLLFLSSTSALSAPWGVCTDKTCAQRNSAAIIHNLHLLNAPVQPHPGCHNLCYQGPIVVSPTQKIYKACPTDDIAELAAYIEIDEGPDTPPSVLVALQSLTVQDPTLPSLTSTIATLNATLNAPPPHQYPFALSTALLTHADLLFSTSPATALASVHAAIAAYPNHPTAHRTLSECHVKRGDVNSARRALETCAKEQPQFKRMADDLIARLE